MTDGSRANAPIPFDRRGGEATVVIFVHGFLDSGAVWEPILPALAAAGYETVTLDLPGMGRLTTADGPFTLARYAADLAQVIDAIGRPCVLVGQSMGAQIAELAALARSDLVRGLALVTPIPLQGFRAPAEMVAPFKNLGGQPAAQREQRRMLSPNMADADLDRLEPLGAAVSPAVVADLVDAWNDGDAAGAAASRFTGPVLVVRGGADPMVGEAMAESVAARFADAEIVCVPQAGHWAHVEDPQALVGFLKAHLGRIRERDGSAPQASPGPQAGADWQKAFGARSAQAFADAFVEDVVLEASALASPIAGRDNVKRVMAAASGIYETLVFTTQAAAGAKQYIEWTAEAFGGTKMSGVTVLTRDATGSITGIAIHHRPLGPLLTFSAHLGDLLRGVIDGAHFHQEASAARKDFA